MKQLHNSVSINSVWAKWFSGWNAHAFESYRVTVRFVFDWPVCIRRKSTCGLQSLSHDSTKHGKFCMGNSEISLIYLTDIYWWFCNAVCSWAHDLIISTCPTSTLCLTCSRFPEKCIEEIYTAQVASFLRGIYKGFAPLSSSHKKLNNNTW